MKYIIYIVFILVLGGAVYGVYYYEQTVYGPQLSDAQTQIQTLTQSVADLTKKLADTTKERDDALEQVKTLQAATPAPAPAPPASPSPAAPPQ
jgi:hypothetical protein